MSQNISSPLALLSLLILAGASMGASAQDLHASKHANAALVRCADDAGLKLTLPPSFERVETHYQGVLCAFRSKNEGFPTINVIAQPQLSAHHHQTASERRERILESYHRVGLTDAALGAYSEGDVDGFPALRTEVLYTNRDTPMVALVMVIELPDRSYTLSTLDTAVAFHGHKETLTQILDSLSLDTKGELQSSSSAQGRHTALLVGLLLCCVILAAITIRNRRRILSGSPRIK